jgi:hypothetical protein
VWILALWACVAHGEPAPPSTPVPAMTRVDLVQGKPIALADPVATATLVSTSESLELDPETGQKVHRAKGVLRLEAGGKSEDVAFTVNRTFTWADVPMVVRGASGWYELVVRPDGRP